MRLARPQVTDGCVHVTHCLGMPGQWPKFRKWHTATLAVLCAQSQAPREPFWSRAFAVGGREWLRRLGGRRVDLTEYIEPVTTAVRDGDEPLHVLQPPQFVAARLWRWFTDRQPNR